MYEICKIREVIRVPPKEFGKNLKKAVLKIVQEEFEGLVDEDLGVVIAVLDIANIGEGKVIPGDGSAYYQTEIEALVFKTEAQEIVEGVISEITEFGAFIRTGPIDGLIHVSQLMNDFINYDAKLPGFVGKESRKKIQLEDEVLARIVTCSLKGDLSNSKIGLTMRQLGLGKEEWLAKDLKKKEGKESEKQEKQHEKPQAKPKPVQKEQKEKAKKGEEKK